MPNNDQNQFMIHTCSKRRHTLNVKCYLCL